MTRHLGTTAAFMATLSALVAACNAIVGIKEGDPRDESASASASGGPAVCRAEPCYTGPPSTRGVGACKDGVTACDAEGRPNGDCVGETRPVAEVCSGSPALDEDCDGQVNEEGPDCSCGDGYLSNQEACDDGALADGDGCSASCEKEGVVQIAGGFCHTCALLSSGAVKCWGLNNVGQLGLGDTNNRGDQPLEMGKNLPVIDLGTGKKAKAITAGMGHTCALLDDGKVKCWGDNGTAQLGLGDLSPRGSKPSEMGNNLAPVDLGSGATAIALSAGASHTCALLDDGRVKCWGSNVGGELGQGDTENRGDDLSEMGNNLAPVDLGTGKAATGLSAGIYHTCAELVGGGIKCWGNNAAGQLGLGDTKNRGDGPDEMGDNLLPVELGGGAGAALVRTAGLSSCARFRDGRVKCWGLNATGALGLEDKNSRGDEPNEMGDNLSAVFLGADTGALFLAAGAEHVCALLTGGDIKCWGRNADGQLGLGDVNDRGDDPGEAVATFPPVSLGSDKPVTALGRAWSVTCAILGGAEVKCWGQNNVGQLGLGDTETRGDEPGDMGEDLPSVSLF